MWHVRVPYLGGWQRLQKRPSVLAGRQPETLVPSDTVCIMVACLLPLSSVLCRNKSTVTNQNPTVNASLSPPSQSAVDSNRGIACIGRPSPGSSWPDFRAFCAAAPAAAAVWSSSRHGGGWCCGPSLLGNPCRQSCTHVLVRFGSPTEARLLRSGNIDMSLCVQTDGLCRSLAFAFLRPGRVLDEVSSHASRPC